jgi:hypothetical protein
VIPQNGNELITVDGESDGVLATAYVDQSYTYNEAAGYISFAADRRDLDGVYLDIIDAFEYFE